MNAQPGQTVDHINRNRADNRKYNLRCCSRFENNLNRGRRSTNKSGTIGVHYDSKRNKWVANITSTREEYSSVGSLPKSRQ